MDQRMRFLIAHRSQLHQTRIRQEIALVHPDAEFLEATALTDTYHLAEHHVPDFVFIAENLTTCGEFELLASLFKIVGIACVILKNSTSSPSNHPVLQQLRQVSEHEIADTLSRTKMGPTSRVPRPSQEGTKNLGATQYDPRRIILIGASTGGIDALLTLIKAFDSNCPPILVVQHTGGQFAKSLIKLLDGGGQAKVQAANDGVALAPGNIYLAPDDQSHLVLSSGAILRIGLDPSATVSGHRPSIDALFSSATGIAVYVSAALLTGMGKDGAAGLTQLRSKGAYTIGQDEQTSVVYGMPRVAMEMGGVCEQLPLNSIGPALLRSCKVKVRT